MEKIGAGAGVLLRALLQREAREESECAPLLVRDDSKGVEEDHSECRLSRHPVPRLEAYIGEIEARAAGIDTSIITQLQGWKTNSMFRRYGIVAAEDKLDAMQKQEAYEKQLQPAEAARVQKQQEARSVTLALQFPPTTRELPATH